MWTQRAVNLFTNLYFIQANKLIKIVHLLIVPYVCSNVYMPETQDIKVVNADVCEEEREREGVCVQCRYTIWSRLCGSRLVNC